MITSYAALRGPSSVSLCRLYMSRLSPSRASRQVAIRLAPYIPTCDLPAYLDSISTAIQETPRGSEDRLILMEEAFKMVTQDLRDEHRRLGMEWWLQWKAKLDDKEGKMGFWKARLWWWKDKVTMHDDEPDIFACTYLLPVKASATFCICREKKRVTTPKDE